MAHAYAKLDGLALCCSYSAALAGISETPMPPGDSTYQNGHPEPLSQKARREFVPPPGWYGLSVNYIYGRDRRYRYFLKYKPTAMAGYSIYIYHILPEDIKAAKKIDTAVR